MRRAELEHVIRAAAAVAEDDEIVVIGSQAILGQFPDAPDSLLISREADVYPRNHPERGDEPGVSATGISSVRRFATAWLTPKSFDAVQMICLSPRARSKQCGRRSTG